MGLINFSINTHYNKNLQNYAIKSAEDYLPSLFKEYEDFVLSLMNKNKDFVKRIICIKNFDIIVKKGSEEKNFMHERNSSYEQFSKKSLETTCCSEISEESICEESVYEDSFRIENLKSEDFYPEFNTDTNEFYSTIFIDKNGNFTKNAIQVFFDCVGWGLNIKDIKSL